MITIFLDAMYAILRCFVWMVEALIIFLIVISVVILTYQIHAKETALLVKKYGKLDDSWPAMLHDGFAEGMRVLAPNGTLVFKWSEHDIPADKVWKAIGRNPLFGTHSGKKMQTFFGVFMKFEDMEWERRC